MNLPPLVIPALLRAEKLCDGRAAFAARFDKSPSTIGMWHNRANIPTEYLKPIEDATKGEVTVYELLADVKETAAEAKRREEAAAAARAEAST